MNPRRRTKASVMQINPHNEALLTLKTIVVDNRDKGFFENLMNLLDLS